MATATAAFGNLTGIEFMSFTMNRGVYASQGVVVCQNQTITSSTGDAIFTYTKQLVGPNLPIDPAGSPATNTITIPDCIIDGVAASSENSELIEIRFLDRRWRWSDGHIDGLYNQRLPDGSYRFEKTPRDLMNLCLDAMGETGYTTIAVDSLARPAIDWRGDNPSLMLQELCTDLGYVVTINELNSVVIVKEGVGTALPITDGTEQNEFLQSLKVKAGALPSAVRVACGNVQYQCMMKLVPVGIEPNGDIKPIDNLSYKPADGWLGREIPDHPSVTGTTTINGRDVSHNELARKSVFKWWQADGIFGATNLGWKPPGFLEDSGLAPENQEQVSRDDVLPLRPYTNEQVTTATGKKVRQKFKVIGAYRLNDDEQVVCQPGTLWNGTATLDEENGIVKLDRAATIFSGNQEVAATKMALVCVVEVNVDQNGGGNQKQYWGYTLNVGGGAGIRTIDYPDIEPMVTANYNDEALVDTTNNLTTVNAQAGYYAAAAREQLRPSDGGVVGYESFRTITLDGIRRQVRWSCGSNELPRTVATVNTEVDLDYPTYSEITAEAISRAVERRTRRRDRIALVEKEKPQGNDAS